jgi:hypothetical protein
MPIWCLQIATRRCVPGVREGAARLYGHEEFAVERLRVRAARHLRSDHRSRAGLDPGTGWCDLSAAAGWQLPRTRCGGGFATAAAGLGAGLPGRGDPVAEAVGSAVGRLCGEVLMDVLSRQYFRESGARLSHAVSSVVGPGIDPLVPSEWPEPTVPKSSSVTRLLRSSLGHWSRGGVTQENASPSRARLHRRARRTSSCAKRTVHE